MRALLLPFLLSAIETVVSASSKWPGGTYGLPRAQSGCPSSNQFTWRTGWRYQDTEDIFPSNARSSNFHLDASVDKNNLKRSFCIKTDTSANTSRTIWPKGKYCIYKKGACPKELKSGYITWDDEDWFNENSKGGVLPDGVYDKNTKLYYCCRTDGNKTEPIELPTSKPFFLVAYESAACQQVKWAQAGSEWIRFDTEEDDDEYGGAYPYGAGLNDHTIHYCYYTSCNYTFTQSTGSFQSPNYPNSYPAGQYCSWRITVPEGLQVVLKFPEFSLQKGADTDNVQLYDGQNETSPSLGVYSGDTTPPAAGVRSTSNELFVIFKTDSKNNFAGFQASYSAQKPTLPPTTVKKTTTRTTVASTQAGTNTAVKPNETTVTTIGSHSSTLVATQITQAATTIKSTIEDAQTTQGITASTSTAGITEATNEPLYTRPTENRPSTFAPLRNESSFGFRKLEDNESSNVALILIPTLCFLLLALCLLMLFLYRKRNQRRKDNLDREQFVYYESNPKMESVDNPLYESGVKFPCDSTENPLYDTGSECAVNPLYHEKHQVTDCYEEPSTLSEQVMNLQSQDLTQFGENPLYDFTAASSNESSA